MKKNYLSLLLSAYLFTNIASANEKTTTNVYDAQRIADIFTKALDTVRFDSLRKSLGVCFI